MTIFTDYFFAVGPNNDQAASNTLINSGTTASLVPGYGGYIGYAGNVVQTNNLQTIQSFQSFNIGSIATDWQSFFSSTVTLLKSNYPALLGLIISGVSYTSNQTNPNYGIYTFSGSNGSSYVQTSLGGGDNLLTSAEANFTPGGWSGSNVTSGTYVNISGLTSISIPLSSSESYGSSFGDFPYGSSAYDGSDFEGTNVTQYDYLVTASGVGTVTMIITYSSSLTTISGYEPVIISGHQISQSFYGGEQLYPVYPLTASGTWIGQPPISFVATFTVSGISDLNFLTSQPLNSDIISVALTTSGQITYSEAGLFNGYTTSWVSPLLTDSMRISTVARILLPNTSTGTYTLSLFNNEGALLADNFFSGLPTQTWIDLTVDYILPPQVNNQSFYAILSQSYSTEVYELSMFGMFYNPLSYQFSVDNSTWFPITVGVNDAFTLIGIEQPTQNLYLQITFLEDYTTLNALQVVPKFTQTPFYNSTNINFLSDPKINATADRIPVHLQPLFQPISLDYPFIYSQQELMNIQNPFIL
jgi:hypothetical protein